MKSGLLISLIEISLVCCSYSLSCEKPWTLLHRNCVLFVKKMPLSWYEAQEKCESIGAFLITVNSFRAKMNLQRGLQRRIRLPNEQNWWVGLHLNRTEAKWVWQDGSFLSHRSSHSSPWARGEPDNRGGNELCADFRFDGKLYDKDCTDKKPFVCERIKITPAPKRTTQTTFSTMSTTLPSTTTPTKPTTTKTKSTTEGSTKSPITQPRTGIKTNTTSYTSTATTTTKKRTLQDNSESKTLRLEFKTTVPTIQKTTNILGCPEQTVYGIKWPTTSIKSTVLKPCPDTEGHAKWTCKPATGWKDQPDLSQCASVNIQQLTNMMDLLLANRPTPTTEDVLSIAANLTETIVSSNQMTGADISTATSILHQVARGQPKTLYGTETILKEVVKAGTYLFSKTETSNNMEADDKERAASDLLFVLENTTQSMTESIKNTGTINTKTDKINVFINVMNVSGTSNGLEYNGAEDGIIFKIPTQTLRHNNKDGLIKAVFMTHYELGNILKADDDNSDIEIATNVITVSLGTHKTVHLSNPIVFTIQLARPFGRTSQPLCSFWNFSKGDHGEWSQKGCSHIDWNSTHVTCQCNHLTNFAVLMDVSGVRLTYEHTQFLKYITYIGCIISITCLALSWITFQCFRSLESERNSIHKNLVFCLFAAELIFIVGIDRTNDMVSCAAIALLLHFFFLSSFTWMFLEGIHIVKLLKQVFDTAKTSMKYYYLVGYGIPITIVGITAGIDYKAYGTPDFCWLTTKHWFIWSFTGPVAVILIINTVVLMYALSMVCRHSTYIFPQDKKQHGHFRAWIQGALAIEVLLGSTWVFGYFFISESTVVMAYIFTVLNSSQGLFIFIFHCLLNKKIRFEYKKLAHVRHNSQSSTKSTASFKKKEGSYEVYVSN